MKISSLHPFEARIAWYSAPPFFRRLVRAHSAQLGDAGALEVIRLVKDIPWPIWEMHLSHNGIGTETAMRLLQALHLSEHYPFVGSRKGQLNPLWLRLEYNRIDANLFLRGCDAAELTYCIPPDRQTCQTKRCGVNKGLAPALHLPFFRSQVRRTGHVVVRRKGEWKRLTG